eukprot:54556-Ditylum_brightwellii.AAC.1
MIQLEASTICPVKEGAIFPHANPAPRGITLNFPDMKLALFEKSRLTYKTDTQLGHIIFKLLEAREI